MSQVSRHFTILYKFINAIKLFHFQNSFPILIVNNKISHKMINTLQYIQQICFEALSLGRRVFRWLSHFTDVPSDHGTLKRFLATKNRHEKQTTLQSFISGYHIFTHIYFVVDAQTSIYYNI